MNYQKQTKMTQVAIIKNETHKGETLVRFTNEIEKSEKWVKKTNKSNQEWGIETRFRIAYNEQDSFFTGAK